MAKKPRGKTIFLKLAKSWETRAKNDDRYDVRLACFEQAVTYFSMAGMHEDAARIYMRLAAGEKDPGKKEGFYGKALEEAGKSDDRAGAYANLVRMVKNLGMKGEFLHLASVEAEKAGNMADAGRYAGLAGRNYERESIRKKGEPEEADMAEKASENYRKVATLSKVTAGMMEAADELMKRADELRAKEKAKKAKKGEKVKK